MAKRVEKIYVLRSEEGSEIVTSSGDRVLELAFELIAEREYLRIEAWIDGLLFAEAQYGMAEEARDYE